VVYDISDIFHGQYRKPSPTRQNAAGGALRGATASGCQRPNRSFGALQAGNVSAVPIPEHMSKYTSLSYFFSLAKKNVQYNISATRDSRAPFGASTPMILVLSNVAERISIRRRFYE
jgi:hypothetical protein